MQKSKDLLFDIYRQVKDYGNNHDELLDYIETVYPNKSQAIFDVIKRGITKITYKPSNRSLWIVIGENDEYLIYPKIFCSCSDFYNRVIVKRKRSFCKHLIAQIICEALDNFNQIEIDDKKFKDSLKEVKLEL